MRSVDLPPSDVPLIQSAGSVACLRRAAESIDRVGTLGSILRAVPVQSKGACEWRSLMLSSHFQPIVGVAGQRVIGYEGLLRARHESGKCISPLDVYAATHGSSEMIRLDWMARALHLRNWRNLNGTGGQLFINVASGVAINDRHSRNVFAALLAHYQFNAEQIVVEITEEAVADEDALLDAVNLYKALGCKVAIDDFGAGESDVRRIWHLHPDIVKVDSSALTAATRDDHALRVLKNMVNMMHDCGAKVVIEGVEGLLEARAALETNADYLQGYFFGRPGVNIVADEAVRRKFFDLLPGGEGLDAAESAASPRSALDWLRHAESLAASAMALDTGAAFSTAVQLIHCLPAILRCYLLTPHGNVLSSSVDLQFRGAPACGGRYASEQRVGWRVKQLAAHAAAHRGEVRLIRNDADSLGGAARTLTMCCGFGRRDEALALCIDIDV
jgi:EAL domain-containing protein (putative c-di-GMP-specific phosphodiesterase class I)